MLRYSLLAILALALLGCGRPAPGAGAQRTAAAAAMASSTPTLSRATSTSVSIASSTPALSRATPTSAPTLSRPLAVLQMEGGFAGAVLLLTVQQDGQVSYAEQGPLEPQVQHWQATSDQLGRLQALLASPEFAALQESYVPANTCCDRIEYTLSVITPAGERVVRTLDGVENPPVLQQTLDLLGEIIRAGTRR